MGHNKVKQKEEGALSMELNNKYLENYLQLIKYVEDFSLSEKDVLGVRKEDTIVVVEMMTTVDWDHQYLCWFEAGQEIFKVHYRGNELTCFVDGNTKGVLTGKFIENKYKGEPLVRGMGRIPAIRITNDQISFKQAMSDCLKNDQAVQEAFCNQTLLIEKFAVFKLRHPRFKKPITLSSYFVKSAILEVLMKYDDFMEELELEDLLSPLDDLKSN